MKFEFSAGGIVFRKEKEKISVLLGQHSYHHGWVFPKGLVGDHDKGEKNQEAAIREVEEETGVKGAIMDEIDPISYWYQFKGEKIKKTVYYFVMKYVGGDITKHDMEMEDVRWIDIGKVEDTLTYKSDREVFKKAKPIIQKLGNRD